SVYIIRKENIRQSFLLTRLQHFRPYVALVHISVNHFLHPVIRHTYSEEQVLNGVANTFNLKKLFNIRMVNIEVCCKSTAPYPSLRNGIHCGIEKLHE